MNKYLFFTIRCIGYIIVFLLISLLGIGSPESLGKITFLVCLFDFIITINTLELLNKWNKKYYAKIKMR